MKGGRRAWFLVLVVALGLVMVAALLAVLAGADRIGPSLLSFLGGVAGTPTALASTARMMTPILLVAVSASISVRAGLLDVGQVGQFLVGGLVAAAAGTLVAGPGPVVASASILAGALAGGAWAWLVGWMASATQVQLVVLSLIANYFADGLVRFVTRTTLQDPQAYSVVATPQIPREAWLPILLPRTSLHIGFAIALLVALAVWAVVRFTVVGHRLTLYGQNPRFAAVVGVPPSTYPLKVLLVSGGIAGLAGAIEVFGVHHRYQDGVLGGPASIAWTGLTAAILVPAGLLAMVPVSAFLAALTTGLAGIQRDTGITSGLGILVQGLLIVLAAVVLSRGLPGPARRRGGGPPAHAVQQVPEPSAGGRR